MVSPKRRGVLHRARLRRQAYEPVYIPNGYVDVARRRTMRATDGLFGDPVLAFITPVTPEVDTPAELDLIRYQAGAHPLLSLLNRQ